MGRIVLVRSKDVLIHHSWTASGVQEHWRHYPDPEEWGYMASAFVPELEFQGKETILEEYHKSQFTVYTDLYNNKTCLQRVLRAGH